MTKVGTIRKWRSGVVDTSAQRDASGVLYYPQHPIGLLLNAAEGPVPCLLDVHSFSSGTEALATARAWALERPGNSTMVYHRESGHVLARYILTEAGEWGYLLTPPQGKPTFSHKAHLFPPVRTAVSCDRTMLIETFTADVAQTNCYLPRASYRAVNRRLIKKLKADGALGEPGCYDTLAELLQHFNVLLDDEAAGDLHAQAGMLLLCFPADYYDATVIRSILSELAPFIYPGSCIRGRWGKKAGWTRFHKGNAYDVEDNQGGPSGPTIAIPHPDGATVNVQSIADLHAAALDILLWRLLFTPDRVCLEADFDPEAKFVRETLAAIIPQPEEDERLKIMLAFEPTFFTVAWQSTSLLSFSPASLTYQNVLYHVETLYQAHWRSVIEQARALL